MIPLPTIHQFPDESAWLAWRAGAGLGASEIAAALGLNPWEAPYSVWAKKRGITVDLPTPATEEGHRLERAIMAWYADARGVRVMRPPGGFCSWAWEDARLFGTPDGIVVPGTPGLDEPDDLVPIHAAWVEGGADAKRVGDSMKGEWGDSGSRKLPEAYWVQAQVYGGLLGAPWWDVAANISRQLRLYRVPIEVDVVEGLRAQSAAWWDHHVVAGNPPDSRASATMSKMARDRIRDAVGDLPAQDLQVTAADLHNAVRLHQIRRAEKALKAAREAVESELMRPLAEGQATRLVIPEAGKGPGTPGVLLEITPSSSRSEVDRNAIIAALEARLCEYEHPLDVAAFLDDLRARYTYRGRGKARYDFKPKDRAGHMARLLDAARGRIDGPLPAASEVLDADEVPLIPEGPGIPRALIQPPHDGEPTP